MYDDEFLKATIEKTFMDEKYYNVPKGISRFDYGNSHGWWVRVSRDRAKFTQLFSDGNYTSISDGLNKAILYRHEILKSFPITIKRIHNRSLPKEPEKRIKRHVEKGRNQPYVFWRARWYNSTHDIESESFPINRYGEEKAKQLAFEMAKARHNKTPKLTQNPDNYLTHSFRSILRADVEVLASISSSSSYSNSESRKELLSHNPFAFEGKKKLELHKTFERNKKLRETKVSTFLDENDKLFCELCGFNFKEKYPFLINDLIEVHHIVPLASLSKSTKVNLEDLMLLCSNCHLAVHQGDAETNLLLAMEHFESQ